MERPMYRHPYLKWVDKLVPLHKCYKTLDFTTFFGEDGKSTMGHIGNFTAQFGEGNQNEFHKLQLFPLLFIGISFTWYSSLPPNFIQNFAGMEKYFHDKYY